MKRLSAKYEEKYRCVEGRLKIECKCDACPKTLPINEKAIAFTTHPQDPDIVIAWESEYLEKGSKCNH